MFGDELRLVHLPAIFAVMLFVSSLFGLLLVVLERAVTGLLGLQVTDAQGRVPPGGPWDPRSWLRECGPPSAGGCWS